MSDQTVQMPALPIRGGCQCGRVRYAIGEAPVTFYLCHCSNCQKQSTSMAGASMIVRRSALSIEGESATVAWQADSGAERFGQFCPHCGVRILHGSHSGRLGDRITIKAGTLDDPSWLRPAGHIWTSSAVPWLHWPEDALLYERQPPDYEALSRRWRQMLQVE